MFFCLPFQQVFVVQWLSHLSNTQKVPGSIPGENTCFFLNWLFFKSFNFRSLIHIFAKYSIFYILFNSSSHDVFCNPLTKSNCLTWICMQSNTQPTSSSGFQEGHKIGFLSLFSIMQLIRKQPYTANSGFHTWRPQFDLVQLQYNRGAQLMYVLYKSLPWFDHLRLEIKTCNQR